MACLLLYVSKLQDGDSTNKKIKYFLLDDTVRIVTWESMEPDVNT